MAPWHLMLVLLLGVAIVVGGVLALRLPAFLALILAALTVGALTPPAAIERTQVREKGVEVVAVDAAGGTLAVAAGKNVKLPLDTAYAVLREEADGSRRLTDVGRLRFGAVAAADDVRQTLAVAEEDRPLLASLQPGDWLLASGERKAAASAANRTVGARVAQDFGATCVQIAILIAMASIVGKCLLDSGAADRIVRSALAVVGERGAPAAFVGSGFLLGIPVFFDTVFYLMIPLGKAMRMRTGRNYLLYVLTIMAGATMAHSLVPPTPGPLFVAEAMQVNLALMIGVGCAVGLFSSLAGYGFAWLLNRRWELPLRDSPDVSLAELQALSQRDARSLPPLWLSVVPILLPVALIAGETVLATLLDNGAVAVSPDVAWLSFPTAGEDSPVLVSAGVRRASAALGDKNIALTLSAALAIGLLVGKSRPDRRSFSAALQGALDGAGAIILITAAGGAFGGALKQTGVAELIGRPESHAQLAYLLLAFFITAAIRTAQGSATVAMITAVGIIAPLAASGNLGFHPVYLAMAIGCGSKPISWMNDSGFWVICKMSGMTEAEGLKAVSPMTLVMGLAGLLATIVGALLFPLV